MAEPRKTKATLIKDVLAEVSRLEKKAEKEGRIFVGITEEQLKKKLARTKSPMFVGSSWSGVPAGSTMNFSALLFNPDPTAAALLFVHVFIGPGNMVPDAGLALTAVDTRFPRLTEPRWSGIYLAPETYLDLTFPIRVPADVERTNYLGCAFLFRCNVVDVDEVIERASFIFQVT